MRKKKHIGNVTVKNLDMALRMCGIQLSEIIINRVIDLVELIEEKGDSISLKDISKLKAEWQNSTNHPSTEQHEGK